MNNLFDLKFWVLPISGVFFPVQLGQILIVLNAYKKLNIKNPYLIFGSSGGNICSYLCHANDWNEDKIINSLQLLDSESFLTSWFSNITFSLFSAILSRSLFCKGYGLKSFLKYFYNPNEKTGYSPKAENGAEILSGVVSICKNTKKVVHKTYSNKCCEDNSFIKKNKNDHVYLCKDNDIEYLKGNVKEISEVIIKSASIPFLTPSHEDDNNYYTDGGILFNSPFSCYSDIILNYGKNISEPIVDPSLLTNEFKSKNKVLKGIFFNPNNCNQEPLSSFNNFSTELKSLSLGNYVQEFKLFVNIITSFKDINDSDKPFKINNISINEFYEVLKECEETNYHYGIVLYPNYNDEPTISLTTKINQFDLNHDIYRSFNNTNILVWKKI